MRRLPALLAVTLYLPLPGHALTQIVVDGQTFGHIKQSPEIDQFEMSGGTVQSLSQGDGHDIFRMSNGHIIDFFEDGDDAEFSGGRIGRVNMKLDNNRFVMSETLPVPTIIDGNLVTGLGKDTIIIQGGYIGGNISTSGGDDTVTLNGGVIKGSILTSTGDDTFTWSGGTIGAPVAMGAGNDKAHIIGLGEHSLNIRIDGGDGIDALDFSGSRPVGGKWFTAWESIALTQASRLTLNDTLTLGDATSGSGTLSIDASSLLASQEGMVVPFLAGQDVVVRNAGTIDLTGGNDAQGRLTIQGHYQGDNGTLRLNTVLAGDDAPSDRLVVSQGTIGGSTRLWVNNLGGAGAATTQNGIQLVEARDGATSTASAFVQAQTLSAGAYDYRLFKGGVTAGSENSWYLRSTLVAIAPPAATPSAQPGEPPVEAAVTVPVAAAAPGQADLPAAVTGASLPLYRPEVPVYAAAPRAAAIMVRQALSTFHQRHGDQQLLTNQGALTASWGQFYNSEWRQQWSGTVSPSLNGTLNGFKVGQDLYARLSEDGYRQQMGFYVGHSRLDGDVEGFALAMRNRSVGDLKLDGDHLGAYWTLIGPQRWYLDSVLQYTRLDGRARSDRGDRLNIDGHAWAASLETGYPIDLSARWALEPQAQLIAQKVSLDTASDSVSRVSHNAQVELTGRVGVRLQGTFKHAGRVLQPYAQVKLWHGDGGRDTLTFDGVDRIKTDYRYTSVQLESGVVAQLSEALSLHGGVQYTSNLDSRQQEASGINLGVRWQF